MTVGNNSAVYNGMMTLDEDTENLPAITNDSCTQSSLPVRGNIINFNVIIRFLWYFPKKKKKWKYIKKLKHKIIPTLLGIQIRERIKQQLLKVLVYILLKKLEDETNIK